MKFILRFCLLFLTVSACDIADNKPLPQNQFSIIFENNNNEQEYFSGSFEF
jgi:hypothetical protein